jgi:transposase-like protein
MTSQTTVRAQGSYAWAAVDKDGAVIVDSVASERDNAAFSVDFMQPKPKIIRVRVEPVAAVESHVHER